jgi:glucosylceramidase
LLHENFEGLLRERLMQKGTTRRDFLRTTGAAAAVIANASASSGLPQPVESTDPDAPVGTLSVWITDDDRRLSAASPAPWTNADRAFAEDAITVAPEKRFQQLLGFGAAFTDGSCYVLNQLSPATREKLFQAWFDPSEMGLNVCRTCIGAADHAASVYSFDDGEADPELKRFSIEHDRACRCFVRPEK